jgi:hypothetical protein
MTIAGWVIFIFFTILIGSCGVAIVLNLGTWKGRTVCFVIMLGLVAALYGGLWFYFNRTASGQRELVDQQSELNAGLDRTVTVYTADGKVLAQYSGRIDIEGNDGGYVLFDFEGKRYTYYNCFVESVANIG